MRQRILSIFVLVFLFVKGSAQHTQFHDIIPEPPNPPSLVSDLGHMLSEEEEQQLETKLESFEKETSNEVAVVTIDSLGYMEVSEFALELARKWNIGKANKRNGVLLLVSRADRKINISPSDRLQGALPDPVCGTIIRDSIVPEFRAENYYAGLDKATNAIIAATKGEFTNDGKQGGSMTWVRIIMLVLFILFILYITRRNRKRTYMSRRGYHDDWNNGGGWFGGFGGGSWGGGSWGGGSSGGGGFGGFGGGGGGFDGGGSSGSW